MSRGRYEETAPVEFQLKRVKREETGVDWRFGRTLRACVFWARLTFLMPIRINALVKRRLTCTAAGVAMVRRWV